MELFLIALAVLMAYGLVCYASPHHRCPKCKGKRVVFKGGRRSRPKTCPKCKGRGETQRAGARLVHRVFWSMAGDSLRERRKERLKGDGDGPS